jgi:putative transposase
VRAKLVEEGLDAVLTRKKRETPPIAPIFDGAAQTIYTWRKRFGTFQADDVRRLKQLEAENARLKKLVAERDLEIEVMKEINAKKW